METQTGDSPEPIEATAGKQAIKDVMSGTSAEAKKALENLVADGRQSETPAEGSPEEKALNVLERLYHAYKAALDKLTTKGQG